MRYGVWMRHWVWMLYGVWMRYGIWMRYGVWMRYGGCQRYSVWNRYVSFSDVGYVSICFFLVNSLKLSKSCFPLNKIRNKIGLKNKNICRSANFSHLHLQFFQVTVRVSYIYNATPRCHMEREKNCVCEKPQNNPLSITVESVW